ncbi:sensor histidine kinase [Streptomyces peucetius]|uniref:Histidine kinase n=1 Tax=Streptomyces peucetius TaxID=1950 RepID=A0ABY6IA97_STRPE|nr:histidine kinase [Streptomyces peucetius]UYQ63120.1 histidine kinase [Streptomyces peucetius]
MPPVLREHHRGQERIELYTHLSLYLLVLLEPILLIIWLVSAPPMANGRSLTWPLTALGLLQTVACVELLRAGLAPPAPHGSRHRLRVAFAAASSLAAMVVPLALYPRPPLLDADAVELMAGGALTFLAGPLVMAWPLSAALALLTGLAACGALAAGALDTPGGVIAEAGVVGLVAGVAFCCAHWFSGWTLGVVRELRRTREVQARLAVAEERLRFARDLHDVLGRNLTVMALKSELAVALNQQGQAGQAAAQMADVQRIAQESQDEVRAVVRGYRTADLLTEIEGARSVLRAAGVNCRVEGRAELEDERQSALAWAVREGTTNVLRHSEARWCAITLSVQDNRTVVLTIENDGVDRGCTPKGGGGIVGLTERLAALGGTVEAGPRSDGRFALCVRLPLEPSQALETMPS